VRYPGGKNGAGVCQTIINQIPPHDLYIEAFAGSAAVFRNKRAAPCSIVIDADPRAVNRLTSTIGKNAVAGSLIVVCADARSVLGLIADDRSTFVYCDPPYVRSARRSSAAIYRHEMTDADHEALLRLLRRLSCNVMISGYLSQLYVSQLPEWRRIEFQTMTRGGPATECLWMNYPEPAQLADYSHLGRSFRERQDLKRQRERWRARLARMPALKREALIEAVRDIAAVEMPMLPAGPPSAEMPRGSTSAEMPRGSTSAFLPMAAVAPSRVA